MKKAALVLTSLSIALAAFGGFKAKIIKTKKPDHYQSHITVSGVTFAADILIKGKEQEKYFYDAIAPSGFLAVRLAVFNNSPNEVVLPLDSLKLILPNGNEYGCVDPDTVAQAVLGDVTGPVIKEESEMPGIGGGPSIDPRSDPSDPQYDPRLDPNDPRYDPQDPRNQGQYPGTYPRAGTGGLPGIILNPGGGGSTDGINHERELAAVDFHNKAHTADPIVSSLSRDRFLYFHVSDKISSSDGITLILPASRGITEKVVLEF